MKAALVTQQLVDRALDGHVEQGYAWAKLDAHAIAADLGLYDEDFKLVPDEVLLPFIEDWMRRTHSCDESCSSCTDCYVKYGESMCNRLCDHARSRR